ncbi:Ecm15p ASCRUDRAFT_151033 [Ascoidea rubescens DSM 1968]|uniref:Thiamine-binding protein domain-containing protein n=1 Tax=Ascoidea rubescens DSM 1968 TaxID=1344418 RepID=A0A1D2VGU0_9ASCO|nr:hypothetical protein ASCRUDRAFT_151033 [Ascoidea rubescens DSM 1968]ODV60874.1 hypothetical protein ASCRUDRAFT_151033 [Ascoidea rubescens DSM 1968]
MVELNCIADICLIPMGTSSPSVSTYIAFVERFIENSGLKYTLHSAGTTIEGNWDDVFKMLGELHEYVHKELKVLRIQSDIRVGTRVDKVGQTAFDKVDIVEKKLQLIDKNQLKIE